MRANFRSQIAIRERLVSITTMQIENYRHIIWDWNGTLLDDCKLCVDIMNQILSRRKMRMVSVEDYRTHFNFPVRSYYEWLGFGEDDTFERISYEFIASMTERQYEPTLHTGAADLVMKLHSMGIEQVILSAHKQDALSHIVTHYDLSGYFDKVIGLNNIFAEGKTANGRNHIASLRHAPHEVLVIGDTIHDAEVAREIGADCMLISSGHQSKERLMESGFPVFSTLAALSQ